MATNNVVSGKIISDYLSHSLTKTQQIYIFLIMFAFGVFLFYEVNRQDIAEREAIADRDSKAFKVLYNYATTVAAGIRERFIADYVSVGGTEGGCIQALILDMAAARLTIDRTKTTLQRSREEGILTIKELVGLNTRLIELQHILDFREPELPLAEYTTGSFELGERLVKLSIDDLARLAVGISASPKDIVRSLQVFTSKRSLSERDFKELYVSVQRLANNASLQPQTDLRNAAVKLWNEWLKYKNENRVVVAQVGLASIITLGDLYQRTQAELDKVTDWRQGKKGVTLPNVPGEIPLRLLIWLAPYINALGFLLMTVFLRHATKLQGVLRGLNPSAANAIQEVPQIHIMNSKGGLEQFVLGVIRLLMLGIPMGVVLLIGFTNPILRLNILWKAESYKQFVEFVSSVWFLYWFGVLLMCSAALWFSVSTQRWFNAQKQLPDV